MMPEIHINWLGIGVAVVAHFLFGFLWYTPLFGRVWAREMGMDPDGKPTSAQMMKGMGLNVLGNLFLAWVLTHTVAIWNPETWGQGPSTMTSFTLAFSTAFFTWLGFFLPSDLTTVGWENRSWKLFGINTSYHFLSLLLVAMILVTL